MQDIKILNTLILQKLNTLIGVNQPLAIVYDYHTLENEGKFPYVTFEFSELTSKILDTCSNERTYTFELFLYQEITQQGRQEAKDIIYNCFDIIINTFDQDPTLEGNVIQVVPVFGDMNTIINGDGKILFASIKINCIISKNIN